jgi:hypothetical protein
VALISNPQSISSYQKSCNFKMLEPAKTGSLSYGNSYLGILFDFLNGLKYLVSS